MRCHSRIAGERRLRICLQLFEHYHVVRAPDGVPKSR